MADHAVSESIYIHDPDFNGIEIYRDRSPTEWKWNGDTVHMITAPLNVKDLLSKYPDERWIGLPFGTSIGHVHLYVYNLANTKRFYQDTLGLYHTASYPGAYFFAADRYHHHVATNTWSRTDILPASNNDENNNNNNSSQNILGLDHYAIRLPFDKKEVNRMRKRFTNTGIFVINDTTIPEQNKQYCDSFYVHDPDGIKIQFLFK